MKITYIQDEELVFDNGTKIVSHHDQGCCERHRADFSVLKECNLNSKTGQIVDIHAVDFSDDIENNITTVSNLGFIMIAKDSSKYLVPCYGENNGYYSTDLALIIRKADGCEECIDLTNSQTITDGW